MNNMGGILYPIKSYQVKWNCEDFSVSLQGTMRSQCSTACGFRSYCWETWWAHHRSVDPMPWDLRFGQLVSGRCSPKRFEAWARTAVKPDEWWFNQHKVENWPSIQIIQDQCMVFYGFWPFIVFGYTMISDILDKCWLMIKNGVDMCPFLLWITHNPFSWNPEEKPTPGSRHTILTSSSLWVTRKVYSRWSYKIYKL